MPHQCPPSVAPATDGRIAKVGEDGGGGGDDGYLLKYKGPSFSSHAVDILHS